MRQNQDFHLTFPAFCYILHKGISTAAGSRRQTKTGYQSRSLLHPVGKVTQNALEQLLSLTSKSSSLIGDL